MKVISRAARKRTVPHAWNPRPAQRAAEFGDLPEQLRGAIFQEAWRDTARWWPSKSRTALRLVCREARDAVDGAHATLRVTCSESAAAVARAVEAGRFAAVHELVLSGELTVREVAKLCGTTWDKLEEMAIIHAITPRKVMALAAAAASFPGLRELRFCSRTLNTAGLQALLMVAWPLLTALSVTDGGIGAEGAAVLAGASLAQLPALRELDLSFNVMAAEGMAALAQGHWPRLEALNCSANAILGPGAAALAAAGAATFPELRKLHLGNNRLRDDLGLLLSTEWPLLEVLGLHNNAINVPGALALAAASISQRLPKLRKLDLGSNGMGGRAVAALARGAWPRLHTLRLSSNCINDTGCAALSGAGLAPPALPPFPALKTLDLGDNYFGDEGLAQMFEGAALSGLETLRLADTDISAPGLECLVAANEAGRLPHLRVLSLKDNRLRVQGVGVLLRSAWARLEQLDLSQAGLKGVGTWHVAAALAAAAAAQRLPVLRTLLFECNNLKAQHFELLMGATWQHLETLDVTRNPLTPDEVAAVAQRAQHQFPRLHTLMFEVESDEVDEGEAKQLVAAWPGLQLAW